MSGYLVNMKLQKGVSMIETLIVFPFILLVGLGIIHLGLVYQAKSNLEYAALMAARAGSVSNINITRMIDEVVLRMAPSRIGPTHIDASDVSIEIINPTLGMFVPPCAQISSDGDPEIPSIGLQYRPTTPICAGASIQDANLLRIKVTVRYDTKVPLMNVPMFVNDTGDTDDADLDPDTRPGSGVDITAVATVRMQTHARLTVDNQGFFRGL